MDGDDAIVLAGAAKRFGTHTALHPTDLVIPRGQAVLLIGANGAGKSTLLRLMAGLCRPSEGSVRINGRDPQRIPEARAEIGLLSHQTLLYDELTARENLRFFAQLYGLDNPDERLAAALATVGLNERLDPARGFVLSRNEAASGHCPCYPALPPLFSCLTSRLLASIPVPALHCTAS